MESSRRRSAGSRDPPQPGEARLGGPFRLRSSRKSKRTHFQMGGPAGNLHSSGVSATSVEDDRNTAEIIGKNRDDDSVQKSRVPPTQSKTADRLYQRQKVRAAMTLKASADAREAALKALEVQVGSGESCRVWPFGWYVERPVDSQQQIQAGRGLHLYLNITCGFQDQGRISASSTPPNTTNMVYLGLRGGGGVVVLLHKLAGGELHADGMLSETVFKELAAGKDGGLTAALLAAGIQACIAEEKDIPAGVTPNQL
ncbi:hypothetical protein CYMTET_30380 [Cymbomonas tetramitiformis]|uniref:Uncharacterized protein n=1 Tax=Cymbomonas tetramitiformis TaxID=36881 RepID=A0AAE0KU92_9CHLO|nr:hypothetical protein CYMTET_30380 [Cymbomonas tetramitiformis]